MSSGTAIGIATAVIEAMAASIAAGTIVGAFLAAVVAMVRGRSRKDVEATALRDGCIGGAAGMFCLLVDFVSRYVWP